MDGVISAVGDNLLSHMTGGHGVVAKNVVGIGIDICDISRFEKTAARTPAILDRFFTAAEQQITDANGNQRSASPQTLAGRFAAKEALAKALGAPGGLAWHDAEVTRLASGQPTLSVTGTIASRAAKLGIDDWLISISHDAGVAIAIVVGLRNI